MPRFPSSAKPRDIDKISFAAISPFSLWYNSSNNDMNIAMLVAIYTSLSGSSLRSKLAPNVKRHVDILFISSLFNFFRSKSSDNRFTKRKQFVGATIWYSVALLGKVTYEWMQISSSNILQKPLSGNCWNLLCLHFCWFQSTEGSFMIQWEFTTKK